MTRTDLLRLLALAVWALAFGMLAAERRLVRRLRRAGASGAGSAIPLGRRAPLTRLRLARLRQAGAVVESEPGRFHLDADGYGRYRRARRRRAIVVVATVLPVLLGAWWLAVGRG